MEEVKFALNISETADALSLSRQTVYKLIAEDPSFPAFHVGRSVRISAAGLQSWVAEKAARVTA